MTKASNLVIVESPSKAKTIGKYLGPDYEVKASMGHVRDLPKSKLGVDIEAGFVPDYQPIKGKEDTIKELKKAAKASEMLAAMAEAPKAEKTPAPVAPGAAGMLKLHDVEPKTAAMLMAIVADKMGKPINELRFISIKEVK